jgi:hypothetical protein
MRPARQSERGIADGTFETVAFAKRRDKRRQKNKLAKAARRKNR